MADGALAVKSLSGRAYVLMPETKRGNDATVEFTFRFTESGTDVTAQYARGAGESVRLAAFFGCKAALLKARSPSCGSGEVYDGTFTGTRVPGDGVIFQPGELFVFRQIVTHIVMRNVYHRHSPFHHCSS